MNIPENGRIIVIDDVIDEAIPLILALSKEKVPVTYYTGKLEELPEEPLSGIRFVFLDIELGTKGQNRKTMVSTAVMVLHRLISKDNGPYFIIAWTKHDDLIQKIRDNLKSVPPILMLNLEKNECRENDRYDMSKIRKKLEEELRKIGVFHVLIIWENIIHKAAGYTINNFCSLHPQDNNWNKNMSSVLYHLAKAHAGKMINLNRIDEVLKHALLTFDGTFLDTLENQIRQKKHPVKLIRITNKDSVSKEIKAKINSKLLLVREKEKVIIPGCICRNSRRKVNQKELFENNQLDSYPRKDELLRNTIHIFAEVSPLCDYVQKKWKRHRILAGVMWPEPHISKIKKAEYIYATDLLEINSGIYKLVFDLRYLTSFLFKDIKNKCSLFRMKPELLVDIQNYIARHINRPGVISLR